MEKISNEPTELVLRTVERIISGIIADHSYWEECKMMDLKEGDIFRMYEPSGKPVVSGPNGEYTIWTVAGKPYLLESGVAAVLVDPVIVKNEDA